MASHAPRGFNKLVTETARDAADTLRDCTVPLFRVDDDGEPAFEGTGVLLVLDGRWLVVTAAHVVRATQAGGTHLLIEGNAREALKGPGKMTAPERAWARDDLDLAAIEVTDEEAAGLGHASFVDVSHDAGVKPRHWSHRFLVVGYPEQLQHRDSDQSVYHTQLARYSAPRIADNRYKQCGLIEEDHLGMEFDHRKIVHGESRGGRPNFIGMSGGGIWYLDPYQSYSLAHRPQLKGFLIGAAPKNKKVIFGPRLEVLRRLVNQLPDRRSERPER